METSGETPLIEDHERRIEEGLLGLLAQKKPPRVEDLVRLAVQEGWERESVMAAVKRMIDRGVIPALRDKGSSTARPVLRSLFTPSLRNTFFLAILITLLLSASVYLIPDVDPLKYIRWGLGILYVAFLPGYVSVEAFLTRNDLDDIEKFTYSVGLSLVITAFISLLLNPTPYGVGLNSVFFALASYTLAVSGLAAYRRVSENLPERRL